MHAYEDFMEAKDSLQFTVTVFKVNFKKSFDKDSFKCIETYPASNALSKIY